MKLLFQARFFPAIGGYRVFDELGRTVFIVKTQLSWGHRYQILDPLGKQLGTVKQLIMNWVPEFELYREKQYEGLVSREAHWFRRVYEMTCKRWRAEGDLLGWHYRILDQDGNQIAHIVKEPWKFLSSYVIDVYDPENALCVLMMLLAIDAEGAARN